jgi:membrane protein DedA with SNARE-associated domain
MGSLLDRLTLLIVATISSLGYGGVVLLMGIESACIPLPSEAIMPFSGYLVAAGRFGLQEVAIAGALGCLLGSYAAYYLGTSGGRWIVERYGRFLLIAPHELEIADRFFERWGPHAVFWGRLMPVVRTFIAFPAGVTRMKLLPFTVYTVAGSYLWCLALAYAGMKLGEHWNLIGPYIHRFDTAAVLLLLVLVVAFLYRRTRVLASSARPTRAS